jgi:hypothetical protein
MVATDRAFTTIADLKIRNQAVIIYSATINKEARFVFLYVV